MFFFARLCAFAALRETEFSYVMILHALSIRNWRNIGELDLQGLDHPIVVLYGPNRTGKSSLVAALRSCLLDYDHDSTRPAVRDSIPWQSKLTPEVTVEFQLAGGRYRLMKRFSNRKDGGAILERQSGSSWQVLERDKEAGREARKLLESENSKDGLNQLLWLGQGETVLPLEDKLNLSLRKRFEEVLGSLLTGRDWDFYSALTRECGVFFTEKMAVKKSSPVGEAAERLSRAQGHCDELRRRFQQSERQRDDFDQATRDIKDADEQVAESREEVTRLETAQAASRERRRAHEQALAALTARKKEAADAAIRLNDFRQAQQRLDEYQIGLAKARSNLEEIEAHYQATATRAAEARDAARRARDDLDAHEALRSELDDRRRLVDFARNISEYEQTLARTVELQRRRGEIDRELSQLAAPDQKELEQLRKKRERALQHRATLDAGLLKVTIRPLSPFTLGAEVDEAMGDKLSLEAGETREISVRQQAKLSIDNFGTIEIKRGREDRSLDEVQRELDGLLRAIRDSVAAYGLDAQHADVLATLEQRRLRREELLKDARKLQDEIKLTIPDGTGSIEAFLSKCTAGRQAILDRQPSLRDWEPDLSDYEERHRTFERKWHDCKSRFALAEEQQRNADEAFATLEEKRQCVRVVQGQLQAKVESAAAELQRLGDEQALEEMSRVAHQAVATAEQSVHETQLTRAEAAIDLDLEAARGAFEVREERQRAAVSRRDQLRGELRSLQGLHEELAAAETDLALAQRDHDELRLTADSHRLLRELFEKNRDAQVQHTTGAIGGRVFAWARQLGIEDYDQLDFATGYLPTGLRRTGSDDPIALETESFGTTEQLSLLVRLAAGGLLSRGERQLAIFDDPLTHSDRNKHRRLIEILQSAATGQVPAVEGAPAAGPLQILILTCHPERFDHLRDAKQINLEGLIKR